MMMNRVRPLIVLSMMIVCAAAAPRLFAQFSKATVLLTGSVTDAETHEPVHARLSFVEPSGVEKTKVMTNSQGKYTAVLVPGVAYSVKLTASQRYVSTESVSFPAAEKSVQESRDFTLRPIHTGTVMVGGYWCFPYGSVTPTPTALQATVTAGKIMAGNNEIEVTIETFADDEIDGAPVPADQGTQRAEALKKILRDNGAPANRINTNPHNPPPPPPAAQEQPAGKGKKKAKPAKKPKPAKKAGKGKKFVGGNPPGSKATIVITKLHSEDE